MAGRQQQQLPLFCPCGDTQLYYCGLCKACYHRRHRDRARFAGRREKVLARDHHLCRVCGTRTPLVVHHRRPSNLPAALITLCRACHARLHRLGTIDRWVPDILEELWAEQHPGAPRQLQPPRLPMSELNTPCPRWPARGLTPNGKPPPLAVRLEEVRPSRRAV